MLYVANVGPNMHHWNHTSKAFPLAGQAVTWIQEQLRSHPDWLGVSIACDDQPYAFGRRYVSWASCDAAKQAGQAFCTRVARLHAVQAAGV